MSIFSTSFNFIKEHYVAFGIILIVIVAYLALVLYNVYGTKTQPPAEQYSVAATRQQPSPPPGQHVPKKTVPLASQPQPQPQPMPMPMPSYHDTQIMDAKRREQFNVPELLSKGKVVSIFPKMLAVSGDPSVLTDGGDHSQALRTLGNESVAVMVDLGGSARVSHMIVYTDHGFKHGFDIILDSKTFTRIAGDAKPKIIVPIKQTARHVGVSTLGPLAIRQIEVYGVMDQLS